MPGRGCSDARATQLTAAFGLAVGVVWGALALLALLASLCAFPAFDESLFWLVYFFDTRCEWTVPTFLEELSPGWPGEDGSCPAVRRTRALIASRFALALTRILTSIALFVAERWQRVARREGRPPPTCFVVYFAWLLAAVLDVVLDAVFIPHYALDISHSKGARNIMELLTVSTLTPGWEDALPEWVTQSPAVPPVIFLVVGSRVAPFLWAAEGLAVGRLAAAARRLHKRRRQMLRRSVRDSQVPTTSSAAPSEEPTAGPSSASQGASASPSWPAPPRARSLSDSEDEGWPDSLVDSALDGDSSSTPSPRTPVMSTWSRLSLLLTAPGGGDGDRTWRWSYVPLTEHSPTDPLPRYTSQPLP